MPPRHALTVAPRRRTESATDEAKVTWMRTDLLVGVGRASWATIGVGSAKRRHQRLGARSTGIVLAAAILSGCSVKATMVPVEGPLSELRPVPTIEAKATGVTGNSGELSWTMPDGETCRGRWSSTRGQNFQLAAGSLLTEYGTAYLSGYSISTSDGLAPGYALATCSRTRAFEIEFLSRGHGFGIAEDNDGNIYRFVF